MVYEGVGKSFGPRSASAGNFALSINDLAVDGENSHGDLGAILDFSDGFGIDSATGGISLYSQGGNAKKPSKVTKKSSHATGKNGAKGGSAGEISISGSAAEGVSPQYMIATGDGAALVLTTVGGNGADGGDATSNFLAHDADGGHGGDGAAGGDVIIDVTDGPSLNVTSTTLPGLTLISVGGNGGKGGTGHSGAKGFGGAAGKGGSGGRIAAELGMDNTIETIGSHLHGIYAVSQGGKGGKGGKGEGSRHQGGNGGFGGAGGTVDLSFGGTIKTGGTEAIGIFMQSLGGAADGAGDGGDGKSGLDLGAGNGGGVKLSLHDSVIETSQIEASGILLQSIGGFAGSAGATSGFIAYGANGYSGGDGGEITAELTNVEVRTAGDHAAAFEARSVGGGGGKGSSSDGFVALGGSGGAGGAGGNVSATIESGQFSTVLSNATGIALTSIGGGGGSSGANGGVVALGGKENTANGGPGGNVSLTVDGAVVETGGESSTGIYLSSIGAGGGNAHSPAGVIAIGQSGGNGGNGGAINYESSGEGVFITTRKFHSEGVLLQSVGGGGGKGGSTFVLVDLDPFAKLGTSGGGGGSAGDIEFTGSDNDRIETEGTFGRGFVAQSIAGGGGTGGNVVTLGLSGSAGGGRGFVDGRAYTASLGETKDSATHRGGKVAGSIGGTISTSGHGATGALVQSVAGGGGVGGNDLTLGVSLNFNHSQGTSAGSGKGGNGGTVELTSTADIATLGNDADAILAQSIGGGGGHSSNHFSVDVDLAFSGTQGSTGGSGGKGGEVTVASHGALATTGNKSHGILAQSVGGGGGKGGGNMNVGATLFGGITMGSTGGGGGGSGDVEVTNTGEIATGGAKSHAILAQSIAGGGGDGGVASSEGLSLGFSYTHGGNGGKGGIAGDVTVDNDAALTTKSDGSFGIMAQSIGGGGGSGGITVSGDVSILVLNIGVGASGGNGGMAGKVEVGNEGAISTIGNYAAGIGAQSIGGSGGNAGLLAQGSIGLGEISGSVTIGIGGSGGVGSEASDVVIDNDEIISTTGFGAIGIAAQSVGGSGGSGGNVYAGTIDASEAGSGSLTVTVGGDGGGGGMGGNVTVDNGAAITTSGHFAAPIAAQSVGGNGGLGGSSYAGTLSLSEGGTVESTFTFGGKGGNGSVGGDVVVTNSGDLATTGGNAYGIAAQSLGGNGGLGGNGVGIFGAFAREKENYLKVNANVEVGGSGGTGHHAGMVTIDNTGNISTVQDTSYGIFAQSIGGGGGDGGNAGAFSIGYTKTPESEGEEPEAKGFSLTVSVGGSGGSGGDGSSVSVNNSGAISTEGTASYGIFAHSLGGGGGTGGNGETDLKGWLADVYDTYDKLNDAKEIYEQFKEFPKSLIEGFEVNIGGKGGASGHGGEVDVDNFGAITTTGNDATAIFAQSVGGGGGSGGDGSQGLLTSLSLAGGDSGGGDGGNVTVKNHAEVRTTGDRALGIFAHSVGGGGGAAGDLETSIVHEIDDFEETIGAGVFGSASGAKGGNGGEVTVTVSGSVHTTGSIAHGIFAQSVGGGGGASGSFETAHVDAADFKIGSGGKKGDGGRVKVDVAGTVEVEGKDSVGIFAQSAAGGDDSYSGGVEINVAGTVRAKGEGGRAILAQAAESGTSDPKKDAGRGIVTIGIGGDATVETTHDKARETIVISGGRNASGRTGDPTGLVNAIINDGTLRSATADNVVIASDDAGPLVITNYGSLAGSVRLGDAHWNVLQNSVYGNLALGKEVDLGTHEDTQFENHGEMSAHGDGIIGTSTIISGDILSDGKIRFDAGQDDNGDVVHDALKFDVKGRQYRVDLGGAWTFNWMGLTSLPSGTKDSALVAETLNGGNIVLTATPIDTPIVNYQTRSSDEGTRVYVDYEIDYGASGTLSRNAQNFAEFFSGALHTISQSQPGGATTHALQTLATEYLNTTSLEALETSYLDHTPEEGVLGVLQAVMASQALHQLLQSCPDLEPGDAATFMRQNECAWVKALGGTLHQDRMNGAPSFDQTVGGFAGAFQKEISDKTFVEFGGQIEFVDVDGDNFGQDGQRFSAGVALKREIGPVTVSSTVGGGIYNFDYDRQYAVGATDYGASSQVDGRYLTAEARISAIFEHSGLYAKPSGAVAVTQFWQDGFTETGNGPLNWHVDAITKTAVTATPMLEVGQAFKVGGLAAVGFLRAGVTASLTDPDVDMVSSLADAGFLGDLDATLTSDRFRADVGAGYDMSVTKDLTFSLLGEAGFSEHTQAYGGYARLDYKF